MFSQKKLSTQKNAFEGTLHMVSVGGDLEFEIKLDETSPNRRDLLVTEKMVMGLKYATEHVQKGAWYEAKAFINFSINTLSEEESEFSLLEYKYFESLLQKHLLDIEFKRCDKAYQIDLSKYFDMVIESASKKDLEHIARVAKVCIDEIKLHFIQEQEAYEQAQAAEEIRIQNGIQNKINADTNKIMRDLESKARQERSKLNRIEKFKAAKVQAEEKTKAEAQEALRLQKEAEDKLALKVARAERKEIKAILNELVELVETSVAVNEAKENRSESLVEVAVHQDDKNIFITTPIQQIWAKGIFHVASKFFPYFEDPHVESDNKKKVSFCGFQ